MSFSISLLKATNKLFPKVIHPFNLQNNGKKTYAEWQYEKGFDTIKLYMNNFTTDEMFKDRVVLDMGCGAAGKSLYYISLGAKEVVGVDCVEHYAIESKALADKLGFSDKFTFLCASAFDLPIKDSTFDTIIMNDFMEHVSDPSAALKEGLRLVKPNGKIYINFPPYYHPYGAHLSDVINMPWVHMFFSEKTLLNGYKEFVKGVPDEKTRLDLRISKDKNGIERFSYINKMTIKKFNNILKHLNIVPSLYKEISLRNIFTPLAKFPLTKEMFVKMVVCVIEKKYI